MMIHQSSLSDISSKHVEDYSDDIFSLNFDEKMLMQRFSETDHVFTDADGTIVKEGSVKLSTEYIGFIDRLTSLGVGFTVVTGKPESEVKKMIASLPKGLELGFLCEKGAYTLLQNGDGQLQKEYVLSSSEQEEEVANLKEAFTQDMDTIASEFNDYGGQRQVWFGWSGSGEHRSILSIDIYGSAPPSNYLELVGAPRDALKLRDQTLEHAVEKRLEDWASSKKPGWRIVHLGNGNTDIAPGTIEKDLAITATEHYKNAKTVQLWGDTQNDLAMFKIGETDEKALRGLVIHREKGKELARFSDFVSLGEANTAPFFELLLKTHQS